MPEQQVKDHPSWLVPHKKKPATLWYREIEWCTPENETHGLSVLIDENLCVTVCVHHTNETSRMTDRIECNTFAEALAIATAMIEADPECHKQQ